MVDVAQLSIKVDTTDLARGEASLEGLQKAGARTEKGMQTLGTGVTQTSRRLSQATSVNRNFGRAVQNTSFQVGDFFTQIASGQRATTAFAQQFPQLAGGFGVWGAAIGAAVAVGAALVPMLLDTSDGAEDLEDSIESLRKELQDYEKTANLATLSTEELEDKFGAAAVGLRSTISLLEQIARSEAQAQIDGIAESISDLLGTAGDGERRAELADFFDVNIFFAFTDAQRSARKEARQLTAEFQNWQGELSDAQGDLAAQVDALQGMLDVSIQLADLTDGRSEDEERLIKHLAETLLLMQEQLATVEDTTDQMDDLARAAASVGVALGGRGADPREFEDDPYWRGRFFPDPERPRRTRRGGGGTDEFARDIERLTDNLRTEREIEEEWYQESQEILANRRAMEILGEQEHREALLRLEEEYQMRMRDVRQREQSDQLSGTSDFFKALERAASAGNDRMLQAAAVFGAGEAAINAWRAHNATLADPTLPWWQRVPAALYVAGAGLKAANAIRSFGSGGSGGAGAVAGGAAGTAETGSNPVSSNVAIQLVGSENATFTQQQVRGLINQINEEVEGGAIIRLV